jgi:hypothetical protein
MSLCLRGACGPDIDVPGLPKLLLLLPHELIQLREWLLPQLLLVLLRVQLRVVRACMKV